MRTRPRYINDDGVVVTRRMTRKEKRQVKAFARTKGIPVKDAVGILFPAEPLTGDGYPEGSTGARRGPDPVGLTEGSFSARRRLPRARRDAVGALRLITQPQAPPEGAGAKKMTRFRAARDRFLGALAKRDSDDGDGDA